MALHETRIIIELIIHHSITPVLNILSKSPFYLSVLHFLIKKFNAHYSCLEIMYNVIVIIIFGMMYVVALQELNKVVYPASDITMNAAIDYAVGACGCIASIITMIYNMISQNKIIKTLEKFTIIDGLMMNKFLKINLHKFEDSINVLSLVLAFGFIGTIRVTLEFMSHRERSAVVTFGLTEIINGCCMINLASILLILEKRFAYMNETLEVLSSYNHVAESSRFTDSTAKCKLIIYYIKMIRICRNEIYEMSCEISNYYSIPILFTLVHYCFSLINNCYDIVLKISSFDAKLIEVIGDFVWFAILVFPVILMCYQVQKLIDQVM